MYNPDNQYRCTIIRGKAQSQIDDLLPFYASIIEKLCPNTKEAFKRMFDDELSQHFFGCDFSKLNKGNQKTIRNHTTEMAGQLFRLFIEEDGFVKISESCKMLLETGDQPAFFKNMCLNFQFPNATQTSKTITERINDKIKIKPFHFIVSLLEDANTLQIVLTKQEVAYYALNSLDVLQGKVDSKTVLDTIITDRQNNEAKPHIKGSRNMQHISEQLNLLELANIIRQDKGSIYLNIREYAAIKLFKEELSSPFFDIYSYYEGNSFKKTLKSDWAKYYGAVRFDYDILKTSQEALTPTLQSEPKVEKDDDKPTTVQIGDKGEMFVFEMEKERVRNYKERLVNKVLLLGKIRGLGYDISSIEAEGEDPEFARYIEVKSTIRVTEPKIDETWRDSVALTAKEWTAAKQYKEFYNVYRVYFTPNKTIVYRINDPFTMHKNGELDVYPTMFQMDIRESNIKAII